MKTWMLLAVLSLGVASVEGFFGARAMAAQTQRNPLSDQQVKDLFDKKKAESVDLINNRAELNSKISKKDKEIAEEKERAEKHRKYKEENELKAAEKKIEGLNKERDELMKDDHADRKAIKTAEDKLNETVKKLNDLKTDAEKKALQEIVKEEYKKLLLDLKKLQEMVEKSKYPEEAKAIVNSHIKEFESSKTNGNLDQFKEAKKALETLKKEAQEEDGQKGEAIQNLLTNIEQNFKEVKEKWAAFIVLTDFEKVPYEKSAQKNPLPFVQAGVKSDVPSLAKMTEIAIKIHHPGLEGTPRLKVLDGLVNKTLQTVHSEEAWKEIEDSIKNLEEQYNALAPQIAKAKNEAQESIRKGNRAENSEMSELVYKAGQELSQSKTKRDALAKEIEDLKKKLEGYKKGTNPSQREIDTQQEEIDKKEAEYKKVIGKIPELRKAVHGRLTGKEAEIDLAAYNHVVASHQGDENESEGREVASEAGSLMDENMNDEAEEKNVHLVGPVGEMLKLIEKHSVKVEKLEGQQVVVDERTVMREEARKIENRAEIQAIEDNVMATYNFLVEQTKLMNEIHDRLKGAKLGARTNFYKAVNNMKKVEYGPIKEVGLVDLQALSKPEMADIPEWIRIQAYNLQDLYYKYKRTEALLAAMLEASKQKQFKMFAPVLDEFMQELASRTDGDHAVGNITPVFEVLKGNLLNQKKAQLAKLKGKKRKSKKDKQVITKLTNEIAGLEAKVAPTDSKDALKAAQEEVKKIQKELDNLGKQQLSDTDRKDKEAKLKEALLMAKRTVHRHQGDLGVEKTYKDEDLGIKSQNSVDRALEKLIEDENKIINDANKAKEEKEKAQAIADALKKALENNKTAPKKDVNEALEALVNENQKALDSAKSEKEKENAKALIDAFEKVLKNQKEQAKINEANQKAAEGQNPADTRVPQRVN